MLPTKDIKITCSDNTILSATLYLPNEYKGAVMMAPATGIKKKFYHSFANFLAENGYGTITYDNRGIGESLTGQVKKSDASLQSWGELDMPAVLLALQAQFPNTHYHLLGHSAGGQLVGLMPNAKDFKSMFNFACSSGSLKNMDWGFKLKAHFFMNVFIPFNNLFWGYTNAQWVGMGEPLPKKVAQQWREWCNGTGYVQMALGNYITQHWYDELDFPTMWVNASDDTIANNKNVAEMIRVFPKITAQTQTLEPQALGLK